MQDENWEEDITNKPWKKKKLRLLQGTLWQNEL